MDFADIFLCVCNVVQIQIQYGSSEFKYDFTRGLFGLGGGMFSTEYHSSF